MTVAGTDGIDLSANEFWGLPLAERRLPCPAARRAASAVLRRARGPVRRAGPGLLRAGAARGRGRGEQARRRVLLGGGVVPAV